MGTTQGIESSVLEQTWAGLAARPEVDEVEARPQGQPEEQDDSEDCPQEVLKHKRRHHKDKKGKEGKRTR
eukprot:1105234-Prorocentrum_lima.AAC.1